MNKRYTILWCDRPSRSGHIYDFATLEKIKAVINYGTIYCTLGVPDTPSLMVERICEIWHNAVVDDDELTAEFDTNG